MNILLHNLLLYITTSLLSVSVGLPVVDFSWEWGDTVCGSVVPLSLCGVHCQMLPIDAQDHM